MADWSHLVIKSDRPKRIQNSFLISCCTLSSVLLPYDLFEQQQHKSGAKQFQDAVQSRQQNVQDVVGFNREEEADEDSLARSLLFMYI